MKIGIVKEVRRDERRVAASPPIVEKLRKLGFDLVIEAGAGAGADYPDAAYEAAGATLVPDARAIWETCDIVVKVRPPAEHPELGHEADLAREGQLVISFFFPAQNKELLDRLAEKGASVIAIDQIPRISRAQKVDALSSMANIAGYRAVVEAANRFGSFFTAQFTAAGKVPPAKVLVIGAGVAGLAAVAAAKGLGAIVRAFDTRAAVREQVESLGGEFLEVDFQESGEGAGGYAKVMSKEFIEAEMALFRRQAEEVNIVITTALIPGKKAPTLWTADMVKAMKPGSVIVDLAAEQGGNCELTQPGEVVVEHGVTIIGFVDLPSRMASVASDLYGNNLWHLLDEMGGGEDFRIDTDDDVVRGALIAHGGEVTWPPPPPKKVEPEPEVSEEGKEPSEADKAKAKRAARETLQPPLEPAVEKPVAVPSNVKTKLLAIVGLALVGLWLALRYSQGSESVSPTTATLLQHVTVFVLACFVGWQVIWNVTPALHTPLMSVTNAISGIIIVGAILAGRNEDLTPLLIGAVAAFFAMINVAGGFLVTQRMLKMFRK